MEGSSPHESGGPKIPSFDELLFQGALDSRETTNGVWIITVKNIELKLSELNHYFSETELLLERHQPVNGMGVCIIRGPEGQSIFLLEDDYFSDNPPYLG